MRRRSLALAALILILLAVVAYFVARDGPARFDGPGPDGRAPVPSVAAIRALASADAAPSRASAVPAETAAIPLEPVRCLVLDGDGRPRAGVPVFLLRARDANERDAERVDTEKSEFLGERAADADGRAEFPGIARERALVCSIVEKERVHVAAWVGDAREVVLRFPRALSADFAIEVVTDRGLPVTGYTLTLSRRRVDSWGQIASHVVQDPDGRFACPIGNAISPRETLVAEVVGPVEFAPGVVSYAHAELVDGAPHRIVLVEKTNGIRGVVVTTAGIAIPEASVSWSAQGADADSVWTRTDAQGVFVLDPKARRDRGRLFVKADGHAPRLDEIANVATTPDGALRVVLGAGGVVEGVVTREGRLVAGVQVQAWLASAAPPPLGQTGSWSAAAITDAEGRYRLEHLAPGSLLVAAAVPSSDGGRWSHAGIASVEAGDATVRHDIRIEGGVLVRGSIDASLPENGMVFLEVVDARDASFPWSTAQCDQDGDFEILAPRGRDARLRIWRNSDAVFEVAIPAATATVDLDEIEIEQDDFRAPTWK